MSEGVDGVDPSSAQDVGQLAEKLRTVHVLAGQRSSRSIARGHAELSSSTVQRILSGKNLPTSRVLEAFLVSCGVGDDARKRWYTARARIEDSQRHTPTGREEPPPDDGEPTEQAAEPDASPGVPAVPTDDAVPEPEPPPPPRPVPPRAGRLPLVAGVVVLVVLGAVGVVAWSLRTTDSRPAGTSTFNDYELLMRPATFYDLDIPPGRPPEWHATSDVNSTDHRYTDLHRTMGGPDQIDGVDLDGNNDYNVVQLVDQDADPTPCRGLSVRGGGRVRLDGLHPGARVCVRTHDDRWALVTLQRLPVERQAPLLVHITVLAR